ncbi:MAG: hypothetical protein A3F35_03450 [Candidatus Woykebacteria bacterium RIFCSPHIGHO2_12_FULL_45_10]|uniref:VTT domain-containing protein n=1 Tax=Candidatus Woykebacteria bacterium RIFCSPHIGHO2_12_FULL_45_10 TaxID=1802603 RepID=A0A1G1WRT2_9BACT|nr:MAG: hypothetical protein A3F35_03450 [Candidatus Woykebacteria bacterium RIFCSPHIGHO2_12_FULL_45_10]
MELNALDFVLHIDKYLGLIIDKFGYLTYIIIFLVIFAETGLVITPFLPGDSLLFALGTLVAKGLLNLVIIFLTLLAAAFIGDNTNYWIGRKIGRKAFETGNHFFKKEYLERTEHFYSKHGGKTIIIGRFVPIIRTFVPFVAGIGRMNYLKFLFFSVAGNLIWVSIFLFTGYFFGNLPFVKDNFSLVIMLVIIISIAPGLYEFFRRKVLK